MNRKIGWVLVVSLGLLMDVGCVNQATLLPVAAVPATQPTALPPHTVYLPLVGGPAPVGSGITHPLATATTIFTSRYWHLSFEHPSGWIIQETDPSQFRQLGHPELGIGYNISLASDSAASKSTQALAILNLLMELSPGQSLADWQAKQTRYNAAIFERNLKLVDPRTITFTTGSGVTETIFIGTNQQVISDQTYHNSFVLRAHGRIIFLIHFSDNAQEIAVALARSMVFADDAPQTLDQLYGENLGDSRRSIEEKLDYVENRPITP